MKKVLAIAGSNHKNSQTRRLLELWLERLCKLDSTVVYEVLQLREIPIAMCQGCGACFRGKRCPLDAEDHMPLLRKKLQEQDIIVFASPVCSQNLSGIMKNFIDRMAGETHRSVLAGKYGFTLAVTRTSGGKFVSDMLWQLQTGFGMKNIDNFVFRGSCNEEFSAADRWASIAAKDLWFQFGPETDRGEPMAEEKGDHHGKISADHCNG